VAQLARTRGGVDDILRGGERRDISLFFVDIRGFTSMSESMAASDVTEVVQMYLDHLSGIIFTWDGTIDKYVGDEIMAFWNAPRLQEDHALLAIRAAYGVASRVHRAGHAADRDRGGCIRLPRHRRRAGGAGCACATGAVSELVQQAPR